jgi:hypothetical protein
MPSTPQNSPQTGETTGKNPQTGVNAAPRYKATATSGQAMGQAQPMKMKKAKKHNAMSR